MQKLISLKEYKNSYNKHLEEITRLQLLLDIEEEKLFALMEIKEQVLAQARQESRKKLIKAKNKRERESIE